MGSASTCTHQYNECVREIATFLFTFGREVYRRYILNLTIIPLYERLINGYEHGLGSHYI